MHGKHEWLAIKKTQGVEREAWTQGPTTCCVNGAIGKKGERRLRRGRTDQLSWRLCLDQLLPSAIYTVHSNCHGNDSCLPIFMDKVEHHVQIGTGNSTSPCWNSSLHWSIIKFNFSDPCKLPLHRFECNVGNWWIKIKTVLCAVYYTPTLITIILMVLILS